MRLGENILRLRKQHGFSQEELANIVEVTRQTISNWELGETTPNPEQLILLSKALHISIDELLDNEVKEELIKKVSNTEQLAGMIMKMLKIFGKFVIGYIIFILVMIIGLCIYTFAIKGNQNVESSATIICSIENKNYQIKFGTNDYFQCDQCSDQMKNDLIKLADFTNMDKSLLQIEQYFKTNNGTCD